MMSAIHNTLPWLTFKLGHGAYAINSHMVTAIVHHPDNITSMHDVPTYIKGIMNFRGQVIPLLDMRTLFGMLSTEEEYANFRDMLQARKQDHIHWVEALEKSVKDNTKFKLATDPHQCAFGRWYDHFKSNSQMVNFHLQKIDRPHKALHASAKAVQDCAQWHDLCERKECVKTAMKRAKERYMPEVVKLLEETKTIFHKEYQELVIVLEDATFGMGLIVDAVLAVEPLALAEGQEASNLMRDQGITSIGRGKNNEELILMIDDLYLKNLCMKNKAVEDSLPLQ